MSTARKCLREPIPEIYRVAALLDDAVSAHLSGDSETCSELILGANSQAVRDWLDSLWGTSSPYNQPVSKPTQPRLPEEQRVAVRMPTADQRKKLIERYGYHCAFCGIPLVRKEVRERFRHRYPALPIWGRRNVDQHAAFQALWLQYDHVIPHAVGGTNDLDNLIVTCAGCNYARMDYTLDEMGLEDPRTRPLRVSEWDGLERFR